MLPEFAQLQAFLTILGVRLGVLNVLRGPTEPSHLKNINGKDFLKTVKRNVERSPCLSFRHEGKSDQNK